MLKKERHIFIDFVLLKSNLYFISSLAKHLYSFLSLLLFPITKLHFFGSHANQLLNIFANNCQSNYKPRIQRLNNLLQQNNQQPRIRIHFFIILQYLPIDSFTFNIIQQILNRILKNSNINLTSKQ